MLILRAYVLSLKVIICIYNTASTGADLLLEFVSSSLVNKIIIAIASKVKYQSRKGGGS